jgi:hypothetical protein
MNKLQIRNIAGNILLGLGVYSLLLIVYFLTVLRHLNGWLNQLYHNNLPVYAFVCLGLVIVQAVFLDFVTTFLLNYLRVERFE